MHLNGCSDVTDAINLRALLPVKPGITDLLHQHFQDPLVLFKNTDKHLDKVNNYQESEGFTGSFSSRGWKIKGFKGSVVAVSALPRGSVCSPVICNWEHWISLCSEKQQTGQRRWEAEQHGRLFWGETNKQQVNSWTVFQNIFGFQRDFWRRLCVRWCIVSSELTPQDRLRFFLPWSTFCSRFQTWESLT